LHFGNALGGSTMRLPAAYHRSKLPVQEKMRQPAPATLV
jgi:hypothetical protein